MFVTLVFEFDTHISSDSYWYVDFAVLEHHHQRSHLGNLGFLNILEGRD